MNPEASSDDKLPITAFPAFSLDHGDHDAPGLPDDPDNDCGSCAAESSFLVLEMFCSAAAQLGGAGTHFAKHV